MIFEVIKDALSKSGAAELAQTLKNGFAPLAVTGVSSVNKSLLALYLSSVLDRKVLVICEDEAQARRMCTDINTLSEGAAEHFPAKDLILSHTESASREFEHERLRVLSRIPDVKIITAGAEAAMQPVPPPELLSSSLRVFRAGDTFDTAEMAEYLTSVGYTRTDSVNSPAQFSVRGSLFDIFPVSETSPVRVELWDDEIDSINCFDTETQRRTEPRECLRVTPALEVFCDKGELADRIDRLAGKIRGKSADRAKALLYRDSEMLRNGMTPGSIGKYLPIAFEGTFLISDHMEDPVVIFAEYNAAKTKAKGIMSRYNEDVRVLFEQGELCRGLEGHLVPFAALTDMMLGHDTVFADSFMRTLSVPVKRLFTFNTNRTSPWGGEMRQLEDDIRSLAGNDYSIVVLAGSEKTLPIIAEDMRNDGISCGIMDERSVPSPGTVLLCTGALSSGLEIPGIRLAVITQTIALSSKRRSKARKTGEEIKSLADISPGDYVVHALHGIGRFKGIRKLELDGISKDYITIQYAGTDVLYVPVTQMDLVTRYIGASDEENIKVNKLSSNDWQKARQRARKAVKDMAAELIALYAKRANTPGFSFSPDSEWQRDFEARFDWTETDDQLKCTEEIKKDMERPVPMDRLLCGDVGFGKTEVAFRAAFKCMLDGKQCAILVPTTVLAWQHYQSAVKRFEHFPFTIELLSRFRSRKEQTDVLKRLARGSVDMVIGTHRLVQKDVTFKDLGLAIVDEEQRFGVKHKEKFKEAFTGIDMLTLSATPIPRTLNMAMSGIRDMSVIEEPPVDRYPVQTYVIEHDMGIIASAIERELRRGGQVYYIYNRVETIDLAASRLAKVLPEGTRIATAHGQMPEEQLSDIWMSLVEQEIDILVCTTIIETGVDVPNVNTLIIEDSDRFGLSQLYQLRGRVGRSNKRAFAYFTFRPGKALTEVATKRLEAIREFTQFGSGFRIAMRDLEIRGAGSILGGSQHGHMEAVGYDLYIQMLNQAIAEESGKPVPLMPEDCLIDLQIEAHIPEEYIPALPQRLDAYRKIAAVDSTQDETDLIDEFIDRYGEPPKAVLGLIKVALTRNSAAKAGISEISQKGQNIHIYLRDPDLPDFAALTAGYKGRVTFFGEGERPYIRVAVHKGESAAEVMERSVKLLSSGR
ncbi:MAG: transcription-repair coupling factor [Oscillospiraceae bacterium]|nr:transcription-repair coupling factor [Oscillospiraceae bacterium]